MTENRTVWKSVNQGDNEDTFIQTSRRGRDGQSSGEDSWQEGGWRPRAPAPGNKASNHWSKTPVGDEVTAGETPSLTGEFAGETHRGLELTQTHQPRNQHQKGPIWLWVVGESDWNWAESRASATATSCTPPPHTVQQCSNVGCPALVNT